MFEILKILILSIVQGLTEFLPVSSSAHLVIFQKLLNYQASVSFDLALHLGTAFASLIYFRKPILKIIKDFFTFNFKTQEGKTALYIILALIPTAIIGLLLNSVIERLFSSLLIIALALIATGSILFLASFFSGNSKINSKNSIISGIAQGLAVIPGLSRSGLTISSLLFSKVNRQEAAKFSFILAIPTILGASLLKIKEISTINFSELATGLIVSAIFGYIALSLFLAMIKKNFRFFAYYCWLLGLVLLVVVLVF